MEDGDAATVARVFDFHPLPAHSFQVGPFRLESWALPHFVPSVGVRLSSLALTVAYTGDTGPDAALADLGRDADLYVMEATDRAQQPAVPQATSEQQLHLSARDAGEAAARAGLVGCCSRTSGQATTGRHLGPRPPTSFPAKFSWPARD